MKKERIIVPEGIRYLSDWEDYKLSNFSFPHILNKVLTGCGFTEYCLTNNQPLVLGSPRRFLLENKEDQHPGEVYYARNDFEEVVDYELDLSVDDLRACNKIERAQNLELFKKRAEDFKDNLNNYLNNCLITGKIPKILVTYDSFKLVKEVLKDRGFLYDFQVVIDEFQSIFIDSRFKAGTELELLYHLQDLQKICFVSATPMLDVYLEKLDEFKDLPYFELDWKTADPGRVINPMLNVKFVRSLNEEAESVVQSYLKGKFDTRLDAKTGGFIESTEAVIFMNSVSAVCQVIRTNFLHIDQCNVLCAKTAENEKKVRAAFNQVLKKEHKNEYNIPRVPSKMPVIGSIPKKGERHKMFTLCTRTVYLGADFYSTCARTFIFSDANIECLAVDISMDLEQILGRQRLTENLWRDEASLFVRTIKDDYKIPREEFDAWLTEKVRKTNSLLEIYNEVTGGLKKHDLADKFLDANLIKHYRKDYIGVNKHAGNDLLPQFNNLVLVAEQRAFDIQQIDYADRFNVFSALKKEDFQSTKEEVIEFAREFNSIKNVSQKLKCLVEFGEKEDITPEDIKKLFNLIPGKYKDYYTLLGPDRIRANSYHESELKKEWIKLHTVDGTVSLKTRILETFEVGERYSKEDIKEALREIYKNLNYNKTPKATDLSEWYILKRVYISERKKNGFEILGLKEDVIPD